MSQTPKNRKQIRFWVLVFFLGSEVDYSNNGPQFLMIQILYYKTIFGTKYVLEWSLDYQGFFK